MSINKWLKRKAAIISLAMAGVEKNALAQKNDGLESNVNQERRHTQGQLMDSLKQGVLTEEVKNLRWRMYKVMKAAEGIKAEITDYVIDENGDEVPVTIVGKINNKKDLNRIKLDTYDDYPLEMIVDNTDISSGGNTALNNDFIELYGDVKVSVDKDGDTVTSYGEIKSEEYASTNKSEKPITIGRMFIPKFEIEKYTSKLNVRKINKEERLLEFYISQYPDIDDRKTNLLINDIKKAMINPLSATFLEIKEVGFITYKTIGADDFLEYQYDVVSLDKIITFNGHYVIKYKATVKVDGHNILEQHRMEELDLKYDKKEKRKNK